jgi:hypothetical protein
VNKVLLIIFFMSLIGCGATPWHRVHPNKGNGYEGFLTSDGAHAATLYDTMNWMCADYGGVDKFSIKKEEVPGLDSLILTGASFKCNAYENDKKKVSEELLERKKLLEERERQKREYEETYLKKYLDDKKEAQEKIQEEMKLREKRENIGLYKNQCKELGFTEGSKKFKDCVVELME